MELETRDILKQKILDAQENVRDYQEYSKKVENPEINQIFKEFSEESAMQAKKLQEVLSKYENIK